MKTEKEHLEYISDMLRQLHQMAKKETDETFLVYLIEMAVIESSDLLNHPRRRALPAQQTA